MANSENKLENLEEQIKKLQERKKRLEQKQRTNVGKYLFDKWGIEEESMAIQLIDYFSSNAKEFLEEAKDHKHEETIKNIANDMYDNKNGQSPGENLIVND